MAPSYAQDLVLLAEKTLPYAIDVNLTAYEPRTDLIAVATNQNDIDIYRLGGQRASTIKRKETDGAVTCMHWVLEGISGHCWATH